MTHEADVAVEEAEEAAGQPRTVEHEYTLNWAPILKHLGASLLVSTYQAGKVVVVNFWATWCVPCIQEIPSFNKLHKEFGGQGVAVVGVSMDEEGAERVQPFLKKHPMEYTVALGSPEMNQQYKLDSLPVTLVFDRSGKQVKRFEGFLKEDDLQAAVKQALAPKI